MEAGWVGVKDKPGHAMSLDIKKNIHKDTVRLRLINAGSGAENHSMKETDTNMNKNIMSEEGLRVQPFIEFANVPISLVVETNILHRVSTLVTGSFADNPQAFSSHVLYSENCVMNSFLFQNMNTEENTEENSENKFKSLKLAMDVSAFEYALRSIKSS
eukprot:GHVR01102739.1.p1 GENE.GHVR01102739.1~~GHVR01102739.1.p1  ORF type:complete len:182 (+),score=38.59 GHVR01102739.1:72-548(+)